MLILTKSTILCR